MKQKFWRKEKGLKGKMNCAKKEKEFVLLTNWWPRCGGACYLYGSLPLADPKFKFTKKAGKIFAV
jgi:hypothetical protein